ncbi:natural killer cell receptor 2B4-like [Gavia stellata]|uniref:natural killer cell receptor 2B4-like n=1 Tax=Gavia stellata TaxID=37040 RepID=UPI002897D643|nr:natural killer cell receptor 2B4-like [Gavia stellata]
MAMGNQAELVSGEQKGPGWGPRVWGTGSPECPEQIVSVSADGELKLLPEKRPQGWIKVDWKVRLDAVLWQRILTAEKDKAASSSSGPFSGRAVFQQETLSLRISPVSRADSGVYKAEFENASGIYTSLCFRVLVWEPVRPPRLEARILHWEQGRCNLSLLCTVPGAGNVSYSWSCTGHPPGALEHQPRLHLQVRGDADPTVCHCNASNPVSSSTGNVDVDAACRAAAPGLFSIVPWWAVAVSLGLALAISVALVTYYWWRKRGKDPPGGHDEQTLTVYEEVGKTQTCRDPNGTSEATMGGNTVYAVISTKTQGPSHPQEPESSTIYSTVQPTRKPPSLKRKTLDPALVSTAYVEDTRGSRRWCPPLQTLPPGPADHHLS